MRNSTSGPLLLDRRPLFEYGNNCVECEACACHADDTVRVSLSRYGLAFKHTAHDTVLPIGLASFTTASYVTSAYGRSCQKAIKTTDRLLAWAVDEGLATILAAVRRLEAGDVECLRYPRFKPQDDATALLVDMITRR